MSSAKIRHDAIRAVVTTEYQLEYVDFKMEHVKDLYGINVFNEFVQKEAAQGDLQGAAKTIKQGAALDPNVADSVASAMKDWAMEKGATHYTHLFQPMTGLTAEKHDSFLQPSSDGKAHYRVQRQGAGQGRAGRLVVPLRHPHLRGARLHRLGSHQPRLHHGKPQRRHARHPTAFFRGPAKRWTRRRRCCAHRGSVQSGGRILRCSATPKPRSSRPPSRNIS